MFTDKQNVNMAIISWQHYNAINVYCRELAPGIVSLTGDRAQGDDSKHCAYSIHFYFCKHELLLVNVNIHIENGSKFQFFSTITCSLRISLQYKAYTLHLVRYIFTSVNLTDLQVCIKHELLPLILYFR